MEDVVEEDDDNRAIVEEDVANGEVESASKDVLCFKMLPISDPVLCCCRVPSETDPDMTGLCLGERGDGGVMVTVSLVVAARRSLGLLPLLLSSFSSNAVVVVDVDDVVVDDDDVVVAGFVVGKKIPPSAFSVGKKVISSMLGRTMFSITNSSILFWIALTTTEYPTRRSHTRGSTPHSILGNS